METFMLECVVLPFDFSLIGQSHLCIPTCDFDKPDQPVGKMEIEMDGERVSIFCTRWSNQPDVIAGTLMTPTDTTETAAERAKVHLRRIYEQRQIPWPE